MLQALQNFIGSRDSRETPPVARGEVVTKLEQARQALRDALERVAGLEAELAQTKARIAEAETEKATLLTTSRLDDACGSNRLQNVMFVTAIGPGRIAALESELQAALKRVDGLSIAFGREIWEEAARIKEAKLAELRAAMSPFFNYEERLDALLPHVFVESQTGLEWRQLEIDMMGTNEHHHETPPLERAARVLAARLPRK